MDEARSTANGVPTPVAGNKFLVGGVRLDRPFRIRRLGHFGFNCYKYEEAVRFYTDLLGFEIADERDWSGRLTPEQKAKLAEIGAPAKGCFMRYGTDHHAMVISSRYMRDMTRPTDPSKKDITVNQITWQVGSLAEIVAAESWLRGQGVSIIRAGRDMPGSNWHVYFADPDGHTIELYWGMEQIGWDGLAKPLSMYDRAFEKAPPLPQISEYDEVEQAIAAGKDIHSGQRQRPRPQSRYDVQGVMLPRPFKITRIGPVRLFVADVAASLAFYRRICGFDVTEEVEILGRPCAFLRASGEHHALALYPKVMRKELGLSDHSTCLSFGVQLANYQQLRDARTFFRDKGWREVALPSALSPGIDYSFMVEDPDGHRIQLYHAMEQLGWEGKPRPASLRPKPVDGDWPEAIDPRSDTYLGEPYLGPWG